jgi:pyruvate dehydrogenase E1 component alpha subunit
VRSLQTSADTTTLTEDASHSKPFTVKLHEDSFRGYRTDPPSLEVEVTKDELLGMYKTMNTMRRMEMAADALYKQKLIRGFCHLAIGQVRHCAELSRGLLSLNVSVE